MTGGHAELRSVFGLIPCGCPLLEIEILSLTYSSSAYYYFSWVCEMMDYDQASLVRLCTLPSSQIRPVAAEVYSAASSFRFQSIHPPTPL